MMIRKRSRMKGNDVERLRKQRGKHWRQENSWYVRTYELPSILGVRRKGTGLGEFRTSDHWKYECLGRKASDERIPNMGNQYIHVFSTYECFHGNGQNSGDGNLVDLELVNQDPGHWS